MQFKINLPDEVQEIMSVIKEYGATSYVVGGCVRDSILDREPHDWDICTPALPSELLVGFEEKGYKVIPTGLQHGTITVHLNGNNYEITTFRRDGEYSDGRHPDTVEFTSDLIYDLERRDFTINAMAYNSEEGLIDPFNGCWDIQNRIIRCVGNPDDRFQEDGLRILRALRFSCQLNFVIDETTGRAMLDNKELISNVSMERINAEFTKMINAEYISSFMLYSYNSIIAEFVPEIVPMVGFKQNNPYHYLDVFAHSCNVLEVCRLYNSDLITKLAAFFHDIGKPHCYQDDDSGIRHFKGHGKVSAEMTDGIMRRLKFDNDTREKVVQLVYYHDASFEVGKKYVRRWLNKIGVDQFKRLLVLRRADIMGQSELNRDERLQKLDAVNKCLEEVLAEKPVFSIRDLEIDGEDIMNLLHINEGKDVGYWLGKIMNLVIDGELNNERHDLIIFLMDEYDKKIRRLEV
mgnify:CR=1 FL=1